MKGSRMWLQFALEDLQMAELALKEKIYNQVCFHSQQSVEKVIKAYIENMRKIPPRTHKITDLLQFIKDKISKEQQLELILLDRFYIPTRYPNALPGSLPDGLPNEKDAKKAFNTALSFIEKIKNILEK